MLKRLATVIWWVGAICTTLPLVFVGIDAYQHRGCADVIADAAQREARELGADATSQDRVPPLLLAQKAVSAANGASGAIDWAALDRWAQAHTEDGQRIEQVRQCQRATDSGGLALAFILTLCLWSAAFIIGGRFWLPPSSARESQ